MKALTVKQPWASAIMAGVKRVENRTWSTSYRGPLLIHAGRGNKQAAAEARGALEAIGVQVPQAVSTGVLLGVVDLINVIEYRPAGTKQPMLAGILADQHVIDLDTDPLATGPFCWILANPCSLTHQVPYRGQQGLWTVDLPSLLQIL